MDVGEEGFEDMRSAEDVDLEGAPSDTTPAATAAAAGWPLGMGGMDRAGAAWTSGE
jgi:hypothetical protein